MSRPTLALGFVAIALAWPARVGAQAVQSCHKTFSVESRQPLFDEPVKDKPGVTHSLLKDSVVITCDDTQLFADEVEWTSDEDLVHARGNVLLVEPGLRLQAQRAELNRKTHLGTFYDAAGYVELTDRKADRSFFGGLEPDVFFWGDSIEKTAARSYRLSGGGFTTCVQATPRWEMSGSEGTITLEKHAMLRNAVLRVKGVPLLYFPIIYYPISHQDRSTGFLMPSYGSSTIRGFTLSNGFFWAINRSQDATVYYDWFSRTGQGLGTEYRYISSPGSSGNTRIYMIDERPTLGSGGTVLRPAHRSYDIRGQINQGVIHGFRLIGRTNYFSDAATQQLYQQNVYDLSQRNRYLGATVSGGLGRYRLGLTAEQTDTYYGVTSAQRYGRAPVVNLSVGETPIGSSHIYVSANSEAGYFVRQDDLSQPTTNRSLWRVDLSPTIRMPVSTLPFLSVTTSASWRYTYWSQSRDPVTFAQVPTPLTRQLLDLQARIVGPVFSRILQTPDSGYAEKFKHLIEPAVTVEWISPFTKFNSVAHAASDAADVVFGGTTRVNYTLTNRLLAKRRAVGGPGAAREILSVEIGQSYYSDSRAASFDQQYQSSFGTTPLSFVPSPFSPVQLTVSARPFDSLGSQLRVEYDAKFHATRTIDASGNLTTPTVKVTAGWSKRQYIPGLPGFDNPAGADHFLNASTTLEQHDKHVGGTFAFNYDIHRHSFLQKRMVLYYNSQCCGVSFDYQTVGFSFIGAPGRSDRRFGVSFTLAGLGSFSNPMGSFGNNSGIR